VTEIPRFSILTICLNDRDGLRCTLDSLGAQDFQDYEWVVVDGGSNDGTVELLQGIVESGEAANVRWVSEEDGGLYDAMNKGIDVCIGEYVIFMNSSDMFVKSDVLRKVSQELEGVEDGHSPVDFLYGDSIELDGDSQRYKHAMSHKRLWYGMFTHHQAMVYRLATVGDKRYRTEYKIGADYGFTFDVLDSSNVIRKVQFPICYFRVGGISSQSWSPLVGVADQWNIRRDLMGIGLVRRSAIRAVHFATRLIRNNMSGVYRRLRFRSVREPR